MANLEFKARDKIRATRKALDCWYRHFRETMIMKDFFSHCRWRLEEDGSFTVVYRGPLPKAKKC